MALATTLHTPMLQTDQPFLPQEVASTCLRPLHRPPMTDGISLAALATAPHHLSCLRVPIYGTARQKVHLSHRFQALQPGGVVQPAAGAAAAHA
jgi:hypothetical protein